MARLSDAGNPRLPDGKPNLTAPAPRTSDGKPLATGVFYAADEVEAMTVAKAAIRKAEAKVPALRQARN